MSKKELSGGFRRFALGLAGVLLAGSLAARLWAAFTRTFNWDEFQFWYIAWMKSTAAVPGRDFYLPSHYLLADAMVPLFRLFPESTTPLLVSRVAAFLLGAGVLFLVFHIARALTSSALVGLMTATVVSLYTDFSDTIVEVRADTLNVFCLLLAFSWVLGDPSRRKSGLAGLAAGLALVSRFKMALALPPLVILGFLRHGRAWRSSLPIFLGGFAVPVLLFAGLGAMNSSWAEWRQTQLDLLRAVSEPGAHFSPIDALAGSFRRNSIAMIVIVACGVVAVVKALGTNARARTAFAVAAASVLFVASYLLLNPALFQYNFVEIVPMVALLIPAAAASSPSAREWLSRLSPGLLLALALQALPRSVEMAERGNAVQVRYLDYLKSAIGPTETVFDMSGTHLYRRGPYHWLMTRAHAERYRRGGWFSLQDELRRSHVSLLVPNYRFGFLPEEDRAFLAAHYVAGDAFLRVPGHAFAARDGVIDDAFEILVPGEYRFRPREPSGLTLDGRPAAARVFLTAGLHHLAGQLQDSKPFELVYTTPERESNRFEIHPGEQFLYPFEYR